jgi:hypothetical protein
MSLLVWVLIGMALWHFTVLLPDRFYGGIIGALIAAVSGALLTGYLLPEPGLPRDNPPGVDKALWPLPGSLAALAASYWWGSRAEQDRRQEEEAHGTPVQAPVGDADPA